MNVQIQLDFSELLREGMGRGEEEKEGSEHYTGIC